MTVMSKPDESQDTSLDNNKTEPDAPIKLVAHRILTGCNPYHRSSVVRLSVSFGTLAEAATEVAGKRFATHYLTRFLGLKSFLPHNGLSRKFIKRLETPQGADFKLALLEAILAVEAAVGFAKHELNAVSFAATRNFDEHVDLIWASQSPRLSEEIAQVALQGLLELMPLQHRLAKGDAEQDFASALKALLTKAGRSRMAPSTALVKLAATKRGIPCEAVGRQHLILGEGKAQHHLYASMTSTTPITAQKLCADKRQTNRRLKELRLPVTRHIKVGTLEAALEAAEKIGFPLIIKPVKGKKGRNVSDKLTSADEIEAAFDAAHDSGNDVLVEQYVGGDDYRLLVIGGTFHSAVRRTPPTIIGDGKSSVAELIELLNREPYRDGFRGFPVNLDAEIYTRLSRAGLTMDDVPDAGSRLTLRLRANVSTGGTPVDVTDQVHPEVRAMAERAAKAMSLNVAGVDYLCTDIAAPVKDTKGAIIEINARPGLDIHVWPYAGKSRDVGGSLLDHCFPDGREGRIPVIVVAGDQGIASAARITDALLRGSGLRSALTLNSEAYANGEEALMSEEQQAKAPLLMLRDPEIDSLVSTVSLRQTARRGMLLKHCEVSIIMDRVKPGSVKAFLAGLDVVLQATTQCIVVGAGNKVALQRLQATKSEARLVVVSARPKDPTFQAHLEAGLIGVTSVWKKAGMVVEIVSRDKVIASLPVKSLTASRNNTPANVAEAVLFAVGSLYGAGLSVNRISKAMQRAPRLVANPAALK